MKLVHVLLLCLACSGCQCGPENSTPVTLRVRNTSKAPLFVDASDFSQGLRVQRKVDGAWVPFVDEPSCECVRCDSICDACACEPRSGLKQVLAVPAGAAHERVWKGEVLRDDTRECGGLLKSANTSCLQSEVPSLDERFRAELCYAPSVPGVSPGDGGVPTPGELPAASTVCVQREFAVGDGVVELEPLPSAPCTTEADCGSGLLCFDGACTASCPPHAYPPVGGTWQVRVLEPEEQGVPGFFTVAREGGRVTSTGAGTLTSVRYGFGTVTLQLARAAAPSGELKAALTLSLPSEATVPLRVGESLAVRVVDASTRTNPDNRAITLRDEQGGLLLVADPAQLGAVLGATETSPLTVASLPGTVGCEDTPCGRRLFARTEFRAGAEVLPLEPGETGTLASGGVAWRAVNVSNGAYASTSCTLRELRPYAVVRLRD
jgi:hypothetical protein